MIRPWQLRQVAENQVHNLGRVLSGRPVAYPPLGSLTLEEDDLDLARTWLKKDPASWTDEGPVREFQDEFARWNGSRHAYAFMGGRVALSACIHALGLKEEDEVILPGYTCVVVPNAFHFAGLRTVYCDIELDTYGPDADSLEAVITPNTRAILIHHLYGLVCRDYDRLIDIAARRNIPVIEDCAQATGARQDGVRVGNKGALAIYSSEQSKVFNTIQGGVAVTSDDDLAAGLCDYHDRAHLPDSEFIDKLLHNVDLNYHVFKHPQRWLLQDVARVRYGAKRLISTSVDEEQGTRPRHYGARMPAPVAALGLNQLGKIDRFNANRRDTARRWDAWCLENGYEPARIAGGSEPVFLRYPLLVEEAKKADLSWALEELRVAPGVWFRSNLHPAQRTVTGCPRADEAVARCINFPTLLS